MWSSIESVLFRFRPCFARSAAFSWFLIIICGFIIRLDHLGASSFIRWLFLNPDSYELMLRFFRTSSWDLATLLGLWTAICLEIFPVIEFNGRKLLLGDTTKVGKEAQKMPAVKTLHQESENNAKPEYICGHHFGFVGLLVGSLRSAFCVPLQGELHEGIESIRRPQPCADKPATLITRMAHLAIAKAKQTGCLCYLALDAYYSVGPMFQILNSALDQQGERLVHVIVRAKANYVGYMCDESPRSKRNAKKKVLLRDIFDFPQLFEEAHVTTYGRAKTIRYFCVDLFWRPVNGLIRFVCVMDGAGQYVLMSSDLELAADQIITIYSYRFKIEVMFLVLKHLMGAFRYHFWTKSLPKIARYKSHDYVKLTPSQRKACDLAIEATERFVNLGAIALGLLQYLALTKPARIWRSYQGWLRTFPTATPSERMVQTALQTDFFKRRKVPACQTLELIRNRGHQSLLDQVV